MSEIWTVKNDWGYSAVRFVRQTKQCVFFIDARNGEERRGYKDKFIDWQGGESTAKLIAEKLASAKNESRRREIAARKWFADKQQEIIAKAVKP